MTAENFKYIYYPYYEKLYRIAFRLLMDVQHAEDIVQETYLKLWDKRHELRDVEQPEAYAIIMVRNLCLNHVRWKKDKTMVAYDYNIPEETSLTTLIENKGNFDYLKQMIDRLPDQQRQIITLRHCEGYSYDEIGEILGLKIEHIRVIISRARKVLREQFDKIEKR